MTCVCGHPPETHIGLPPHSRCRYLACVCANYNEPGTRYTFEVQSDALGFERVLLRIDDKPWNEFMGPVAKGVIALLRGR